VIYLDTAATTPVRREVLEAMWPFLTGEFGNASSQSALGRRAAAALKDARERVAVCLGCRASEIIFTSGGTEADNFAIKGIALANPRGRHVITSSIEHEAVLESCAYLECHHGFDVTRLAVDHLGMVPEESFRDALRDDTTLATIMLANNEVGTVQPVATLAAASKLRGSAFHTDAVQAPGLLDVEVNTLGVDALSLSGHKLGAPKGFGCLYLRGRVQAEPLVHGGGQERGRRSGTENVAGAVGFALALELATRTHNERAARLGRLRDQLIHGVLTAVPQAVLTGHATARLAANASFCFPGTSGESMLLQLEERGIVCSSGSACAAGRDEPSYVLLAMGYTPAVAQTAVRFSLSDAITEADVATVIHAVGQSYRAIATLGAH